MNMLDTPIEYLKGVGPQRAEVLKKELGIFIYRDLLTYYPFRYVDRTRFYKISEISEDLPYIQLRGVIERMEVIGQKSGKRLSVMFRDNTGIMELVWFKGYNWVAQKIQTGIEYCVFGKPSIFNGRFNLAHPEIEPVTEEFLKQQSAFQSVYNSTEKLKVRGLDSEGIRKVQRVLINQLQPQQLEETLSEEVISDHQLMARYNSLQQIHFPDNAQSLRKAEFRIKFDELFYIQLRLLRLNKVRANTVQGFVFSKVGETFNDFFSNHLPFQLTNAQKRVLKEIRVDTGSGRQMNRLLQGDVGSGKTLVSFNEYLISYRQWFSGLFNGANRDSCSTTFRDFQNLIKKHEGGSCDNNGFYKNKSKKTITRPTAEWRHKNSNRYSCLN